MSYALNQVVKNDCLIELTKLDSSSADLIYLDPPFFTNKQHTAITRDRSQKFSFCDFWNGLEDYSKFMEERLKQMHRILKNTGSIFVHCDTNANFLLRALLDEIFGAEQFRSEIIWTYRRWSNSAKGLMPAHQTILFYSKTASYKFNKIYGDYSETTNIDQILQLRSRDEHGVSKYATDSNGNIVFGGEKKGVPLSDVWEIPFLNPKAKERTGYPTQKPILLLERIIEIASDPDDVVIDPFCGSGTTLVAASILGRQYLGFDSSLEAVELSRKRLQEPTKTESNLLKKGRSSYVNADADALALLTGLDFVPVQRNNGIDAFLKATIGGASIPIRVQRPNEAITETASLLNRAAKSKNSILAILIRTNENEDIFSASTIPSFIKVVDATALEVKKKISELLIHFESDNAANKTLQRTPLTLRR
jgi:site-specific DNA-methyltransferase (adenine-specific)